MLYDLIETVDSKPVSGDARAYATVAHSAAVIDCYMSGRHFNRRFRYEAHKSHTRYTRDEAGDVYVLAGGHHCNGIRTVRAATTTLTWARTHFGGGESWEHDDRGSPIYNFHKVEFCGRFRTDQIDHACWHVVVSGEVEAVFDLVAQTADDREPPTLNDIQDQFWRHTDTCDSHRTHDDDDCDCAGLVPDITIVVTPGARTEVD